MASNEFVSGNGLAKVVGWLFFAAIAMQVILIIAQVFEIELLLRIDGSGAWTQAEAEANDTRNQLIAIVELLVFIVGAIVFLVWLYRVRANLPALGIDDARWSAGWAVAWWFIPIMSFFRPYQVVKEVWQASSADAQPGTWRDAPMPAFFAVWWSLFLFGNIASAVASRIVAGTQADVGVYIAGDVLYILSEVVWLFGALLAIRIVREIDRRQSQPRVNLYDEVFA